MTAGQVVVEGRAIRVTNLDKVLYPATGTTKGEVLAYYQQVAPWMVPLVERRPATRKRWPDGVGAGERGAFFEKNLRNPPEWMHTARIEHSEGANTYPLVDDAATLVWLAQLAALELHVPQWRFDADLQPGNPDRLVLDLDPGEGSSKAQLVELAHLLREVLAGVGLSSVPVTSGSKGIHVYAPLDGSLTTEETAALAHELARSLEGLRPDLVVSDMKKERRTGKVMLDWSQNNGSKTTVAPYSLRGRERPTVAAPRTWDEITEDVEQLEFSEVIVRLQRDGDPLRVAPAEPAPARPIEVAKVSEDKKTVEPAEELIAPMLASAAEPGELERGEWVCEVKWDGYRAVASVADGRVSWTSRGGRELGERYPELAELGSLLEGRSAVLDGEIVVLDDEGRSNFELLQNRGRGTRLAHYMAFDLLRLDGRSLLRRPWHERRKRLEELLGDGGAHVHVPDVLGTDPAEALDITRELNLEGIVAKARTSVYQPGRRAQTWLKVKHQVSVDVIVVGWTPGTNARARTLGALILALPTDDGLTYVGKAGTGFTQQQLADIKRVLADIEVDHPTASAVPPVDARVAHWVEPLLVGEVRFAGWTDSGKLRHPVWLRWRPDMDPDDVAGPP